MRLSLRAWQERLLPDRYVRLLALALSETLVLALTFRTIGYRLDDALIFARYARNFLAGHGMVYNPGEIHNAVSSPLFVWLLVAAGGLGWDIPSAANLIGGLCTAATVYLLIFQLFPRDESPFIGAAAGLLYATANLNYLTFGMESPLLILLLTAMLAAYRAERWMLFAVLVGLAGMTRAEAVFLAAPLYLALWLKTRRLPWQLACVSLAVMAPFFLFNQLFYGHILADTLAAKIHQGRSGFWGGRLVFPQGAKEILLNWYIGLPVLPVPFVLSALALTRRRSRDPAWWIAGFVGALMLFYTLLPIPAYHWYLLPVVWAFCILSPIGVAAAYEWSAKRGPAARVAVLAVGLAGLGALFWAHGMKLVRVERGPFPPYFRIAQWLNGHVPAGSSLGVAEVGHLGWYTDLRLVDMVGLISPGNAEALGRRDVDQWIARYRPDYILIHQPAWPQEAGADRALQQGRYRVHAEFAEPGYLLLVKTEDGRTERAPGVDGT